MEAESSKTKNPGAETSAPGHGKRAGLFLGLPELVFQLCKLRLDFGQFGPDACLIGRHGLLTFLFHRGTNERSRSVIP